MIFCTLFYSNYLTRAMALSQSLLRHCQRDFKLVMLCMDQLAAETCARLGLARARVLPISVLESGDPELAAMKPYRTIGEYCWTCTAPLMLYLLDRVGDGELVVYLDADMMFFSDPLPIFEEWGDRDIAIHEHRFAPEYRHHERQSGRFNVGWVGVRNTAVGRACLTRWRAQCIAECVSDGFRGLCGDQTYLNEWPTLYGERVTILQNPGVGLGPWNIGAYQLSQKNGILYADEAKVIFYHYHSIGVFNSGLRRTVIIPSTHGYRFSAVQHKLLYKPYVRALRQAEAQIRPTPRAAEVFSSLPALLPFLRQKIPGAKAIARGIAPPLLWGAAKRIKRHRSATADVEANSAWSGDYSTWDAAARASSGYADLGILEKTRLATARVRDGIAAFERDSVTFGRTEYSYPLLAGLLRAAAADGGRLSVLDFGGALGSSYYQCRAFLAGIGEMQWSVVEQPAHVACGRAEFSDEHLSFFETIEACLASRRPNVLLLSSVVQYLPQPYEFLRDAVGYGFSSIIVDRTPFVTGPRDRLTVQRVPAWIYDASYPCWLLSEHKFLSVFSLHYRLVASFPALDDAPGQLPFFKGFIFERDSRPVHFGAHAANALSHAR